MNKIAIIGATGMVGRELISILEERKFPLKSLELYASSNSLGEEIDFLNKTIKVKELTKPEDIEADIVFLAIKASLSKKIAPILAKRCSLVLDKSSAFREDENILLCVPEVNGHKIKDIKTPIIAIPNCVAIPLTQVLKPLHDHYGLVQVIAASYQAVSGAGREAVSELETQVRDMFNLREVSTEVFEKRIAFNVLPHIPEEEEKVIAETKKLLGLKNLWIDVTCVRVPLFNGHSVAIHMAFEKACDIKDVKDLLIKQPFLKFLETPTPIEATGIDETLVGRIRENKAVKNGVSLFISSDNLRTGAALNAVKVAEEFLKECRK